MGEETTVYSIQSPEADSAQPTVLQINHVVSPYGKDPINTTCPHCKKAILTRTSPVSGRLTWTICMLLIAFFCFFGCCLIPFCVNSCKDVEHTCPECHCFIHKYERMGGERAYHRRHN